MGPHAINHLFSVVAAGIGGGLAPVPGSEAPLLVLLQAAMIQALAVPTGARMSAPAAVELALTLSATVAGRRLARTLLRAVPDLGPLAGAITVAILTEAVGWAALAWMARDEAGS